MKSRKGGSTKDLALFCMTSYLISMNKIIFIEPSHTAGRSRADRETGADERLGVDVPRAQSLLVMIGKMTT